ncbi:hypothetical protein D3C86_2112880 [compost metagenome]
MINLVQHAVGRQKLRVTPQSRAYSLSLIAVAQFLHCPLPLPILKLTSSQIPNKFDLFCLGEPKKSACITVYLRL